MLRDRKWFRRVVLFVVEYLFQTNARKTDNLHRESISFDNGRRAEGDNENEETASGHPHYYWRSITMPECRSIN